MSNEKSELMKAAERAAAFIATWSPAKREYGERVIAANSGPQKPVEDVTLYGDCGFGQK